jgi:hypothetical protein
MPVGLGFDIQKTRRQISRKLRTDAIVDQPDSKEIGQVHAVDVPK